MTVYIDYFELHFASIRSHKSKDIRSAVLSHNSWSYILTLWSLVEDP